MSKTVCCVWFSFSLSNNGQLNAQLKNKEYVNEWMYVCTQESFLFNWIYKFKFWNGRFQRKIATQSVFLWEIKRWKSQADKLRLFFLAQSNDCNGKKSHPSPFERKTRLQIRKFYGWCCEIPYRCVFQQMDLVYHEHHLLCRCIYDL